MSYQTGVDRGVIYKKGEQGIPWNGLISIEEKTDQDGPTTQYIDGQKYLVAKSTEGFSASLEAFGYPDIVKSNTKFDFSYRTLIGDDGEYALHLVYNAYFRLNDVTYETINASSDASVFSFDISTVPVKFGLDQASSHFIIPSNGPYSWVLEQVENTIYGSVTSIPLFPTIQDLLSIFEEGSILKIVDHGDGTWSAIERPGYEGIIQMLDTDLFEITWSSAAYLDSEKYKISSL